MTVQDIVDTNQDSALREQALRRLKKKRDFHAHVIVYTLVNSFIVAIWAVTDSGFFWPIFPLAGWGIWLVMNAYDVYRGGDFTETDVQREMARLRDDRERAAGG